MSDYIYRPAAATIIMSLQNVAPPVAFNNLRDAAVLPSFWSLAENTR